MHTVPAVMSDTQPSHSILSQFDRLLQQQSYGHACTLLARQLDFFCHWVEPTQARYFLQRLPALPQTPNTHLLYIEGILLLCASDYGAASVRLTLACARYRNEKAYTEAMQATLALTKVGLITHDLDAAAAHLEESRSLLQKGLIHNRSLFGDFCLRMAQVLWARYRFAASYEYGQQALTTYTEAKRWRQQVDAQLHLAMIAVRLGYYAEAQSRLCTVQRWIGRHPTLEGQFLYVELYLCTQRRQLAEALHLAQRYRKLVDGINDGKAQLMARLLLGNLYRESEEFVTAMRWYGETSQLVKSGVNQVFQQQLDLEYTWLHIVDGRLMEARQRIYAHSGQAPLESAMNFQTQLAIIHLLEGDLKGAEGLLQESLTFYRHNGDQLACCALHLYLAYIALQQQRVAAILYHLEHSFGWMNRHEIESFSQWWHPDLLAAICSQTLAADLYSELSERILVNYLGNHGLDALTPFLHHDDIEARRRVYRLLHIISGATANLLAHLPEVPGKAALMWLLRDGALRADRYPFLEQELMTANYRRLPNVTMLAVFGLYINGVSRTDIATQLECSIENVRNYITQIYQHFGVSAQAFSTRRARWQRLVEVSRERGFIE